MKKEFKGIETRKNKNGFVVVSVHYTANPDKDEEFISNSRKGYPVNKWNREMELDFSSGEGDPVYHTFDVDIHTAWLKFNPKYEVIRGWDFGRKRPACIWIQDDKDANQIYVLKEFLGSDMHFSEFINKVLLLSKECFTKAKFIDCCDPYGGVQRGDKSQFSNIEMMSAYNIYPTYQRTSIEKRVQKVEKLLDPNYNHNKPGIVFDKSCILLIAGMRGGLVLDSKEKPKKDKKYEDVHEAMCYAIDNIKNLSFWDDRDDDNSNDDIDYSPLGRPIF